MNKKQLGQTGIEISPLGLGTVKFGRNVGVKYPAGFEIPDEAALANLLSIAKELGINLLDTAPSYGTSEERLGRLLKGQRNDWVIVGKAGEEFEGGQGTYESSYNFSPEHFEMSLERSLKRLQTDYLDVLLIHSDGADMNILGNEALIEKLFDFKQRGLVRAVGASTKTPEGGIMALELLDVVMATYNPAYTDEKPVLDYAAKNNKGALIKKALASGNLSSLRKQGSSEQEKDSRLRGKSSSLETIQSAMAFAFSHPGSSAAIIGTINPAHLKANAESAIKLG